MARRLQDRIANFGLEPWEFIAYNDDDDLPRSPARDDIEWTVQGVSIQQRGIPGIGGDRFGAQATLPLVDGEYVTDADFDVGTNGPRVCRSPRLEPDLVRRWGALELLYSEPTDTRARFRLWDGTDDRWWDGAAWSIATDDALHWNTAADARDNFGAFPVVGRALQVVCWLGTDSSSATPAFYGYRVLFGCRDVGDLDDALVRTVLRSMRDELRAMGTEQLTLPTEISTAAPHTIGEEFQYWVRSVDAVFDLTADPDELVELPGTFTPNNADELGGTWGPTTPIPAGQLVRLEYSYTPHVVVTQHRQVVQLDRFPSVRLTPDAPAAAFWRRQDHPMVRNLDASPPTAWVLEDERMIEQAIDVVINTEFANDLERLKRGFVAWFQGGGNRELVSGDTGRRIVVRMLGDLETVTNSLSSGIEEARGTLLLTYPAVDGETAAAAVLVEPGGVIVSLE